MSRLRLAAGCGLLKLACCQCYTDAITAESFQILASLIQVHILTSVICYFFTHVHMLNIKVSYLIGSYNDKAIFILNFSCVI